jgi:hypothetical protein
MSEQVVRLAGPPQAGWRFAHFVLAACAFGLAALWVGGGVSLWFALIPTAAAVCLAAIAALLDDTETWVRPEGLTVSRRNLFRTMTHTAPVSEVKAIWVRPDWSSRLLAYKLFIVPLTWRVVIATAHHGRVTGGQSAVERDAWTLEQRVRRTLGW